MASNDNKSLSWKASHKGGHACSNHWNGHNLSCLQLSPDERSINKRWDKQKWKIAG